VFQFKAYWNQKEHTKYLQHELLLAYADIFPYSCKMWQRDGKSLQYVMEWICLHNEYELAYEQLVSLNYYSVHLDKVRKLLGHKKKLKIQKAYELRDEEQSHANLKLIDNIDMETVEASPNLLLIIDEMESLGVFDTGLLKARTLLKQHAKKCKELRIN